MGAYLTDTHIFIWLISNSVKLTPTHKRVLDDPNNSILLSTASLWEIAIKQSTGKLKTIAGIKDLEEQCKRSEIIILHILPHHIQRLSELPIGTHKDPFDRLLVAQAIAENLVFIRDDVKITNSDVVMDGLQILE